MQIYKLFYKHKKDGKFCLHQIETPYIVSESGSVFGLKIDPESYRDFINYVGDYIYSYNVDQHIMTDYKFTEIARLQYLSDFKISIREVEFYDKNVDDDLTKCLEDALWNSESDLICSLLKESVEIGHSILYIILNMTSKDTDISLKVSANGTISLDENELVIDNNPIKQFIDFLVKGPNFHHA